MAKFSFKRVEKKYIVTKSQRDELLKELLLYMEYDKYCVGEKTYKIQNIYYDTPDDVLISKSIQKPVYKEKLRARKYVGTKNCFLEIKKKADGVVGKRRITLSLDELDDFVLNGKPPVREKFIDKQVIKEIQYLLNLYPVVPKVYISYERLALFDKEDSEFRITFDNQIHTKRNNVVFDQDDYEVNILDEGLYILEIKSVRNYPLWLVNKLSELKIYPHSFSKYGTEYKMYYINKKKEKQNA